MHTLPIPVRPSHTDSRAAQVFVDIVADGLPVRMLLDTGTSRTWIPYRESAEIVGTDGGKPLDVLTSHACHFRFGAGVLELDGQSPAGHLIPLTSQPGLTPTMSARWDGTSALAMWDTGAGIAIVNRSWAQRHPEIVSSSEEFGTGTDAYGRTGRNPKGTIARCRIGNVEFPEQRCGIAPMGPELDEVGLTVGMPLIAQADWYFDFPRRLWCNHVQPPANGRAAN